MNTEQHPPQPVCNRCAHYFITHEVALRYGCRILQFKSRRQPSLDVFEASGQPCQFWQQKK